MPEHYEWDWSWKLDKLRLPGYQVLGIECVGQMQGLMLLTTAVYLARLPAVAGQPIVYVNYLESAPWNVRPLTDNPLYGGVGVRLLAAAVQTSVDEGFEGRVGLHSPQQAERFYECTCGMTRVGTDPKSDGLIYYEFTRDQAAAFTMKEVKR